MDEAQLQHLFVVLGNITSEVTIDWAEVARVRNISRKDNAVTAFKGMMKKHNIEYANNKFSFIDATVAANPPSEKKAKPTTPRKRKPKATEEDAEDGKSESGSPKKKQKGKKKVAEVEKEAEKETEKETVGDEEV